MRSRWGLLIACLLVPNFANASIGTVSTLSGENAQLERSSNKSSLSRSSSIESNDLILVGNNTNVDIRFVDNTNVKITPNSRLLIDSFVYDPGRSDAGRVGLRVALGSVRYASGQIAKSNPQQVSINTPTSTIAVRGTDFSMTVDESGRSMVVMLPSCQSEEQLKRFEISGNCVTGEILVTSITGGTVVLNQPFTATLVEPNQPPTPPVAVSMDLSQVATNAAILRTPSSIQSAVAERNERRNANVSTSLNSDERHVHMEATNSLAIVRILQISNASSSRPIDSKSQAAAEASVTSSSSSSSGNTTTQETSNCHPFTECGNLRGTNYYIRTDEARGNSINIRTNDRTDNVTYNISVNSNDVETRVIGNGTSTVTIRQWNR